jgi:hypothetical protein
LIQDTGSHGKDGNQHDRRNHSPTRVPWALHSARQDTGSPAPVSNDVGGSENTERFAIQRVLTYRGNSIKLDAQERSLCGNGSL